MKKNLKISFLTLFILLFIASVTSTNVMAKTVKTKGWYSTYTCKKQYGSDIAIAKKIVFKGEKVTFYGSFNYSKTESSSVKRLKVQKRTFYLSPKCKYYYSYWDGSGTFKYKKLSKSQFKNLILPLYDMPCSVLDCKVKNGKITAMYYGQG